MREYTRIFIQLHLRAHNCEPSDARVNAYLDLQSWPDATEHGRVDAEIMCTPAILSIRAAINASGIMVGDPTE